MKYAKSHTISRKDMYVEGIYKLPLKNIIDFEKTLSVEEAIARSKESTPKEQEKKKIGFFKKNKQEKNVEEEPEKEVTYTNQILNWKK